MHLLVLILLLGLTVLVFCVRFTSLLNTLHWPSGSVDLGHFGISFLELLILFEQCVGHRLLSEKVTRPHVRANRPILIPLFLDGLPGSIPFELLKDVDLLLLINRMLRLRGTDTVRVTKVKGHAEDVDVQQGRVRLVDKQGNAEADALQI